MRLRELSCTTNQHESQTDSKAVEKTEHGDVRFSLRMCVCDITVCLCATSILSTQVRPLRILPHTAFTLTHICCYYSTRRHTNIFKLNIHKSFSSEK